MKSRIALETIRLKLRDFSLDDGPRVQQLVGDRQVSRQTESIPYPYNNGMAEEWISTHQSLWDDGLGAHFALERKKDAVLMGCVGLAINPKHDRAELGYWIGVDYWGHGYCTESCVAVVNFGFSTLNLNRIEAIHLVSNPASGAVMRKLGMQHEGTMKSYVAIDEGYGDMERYAVIASQRIT